MGVAELPAWLEADHGALTDGILRGGEIPAHVGEAGRDTKDGEG